MPPYPPYGPPPTLVRRLREDEWPPLGEFLKGLRVHGCIWAMAAMCAWPLVVGLLVGYPLARSARRPARRIFPSRSRHRHPDDDVTRVQRRRAWTATLMSLLILAVYGKPEDVDQAQQQFMMRLTVSPWLLLLSAPVVVAALFRWSSPNARRAMRAPLRTAGKSALWYVGAFTAVPLLGGAIYYTRTRLEQDMNLWAPLALLVPLLWVLLFIVFATGPAVRSAFNTVDVHPALPALLTGALVWEFSAINLAVGGLPPGPPLVQLAALVGGPASVTAVAWWEIHRLRVRHGVRLRA
ncbi:hypothetical protein PV755_08360 [Streptomyces caniscabiei]|nr:hypothetical protein [Streptomyces caniscabiei]MDX3508931.1 hypothetical protein [Streptomyces caniscabiei]MDX3717316.1 hypothetical protein [Streptomyces caniscabiei]MDX3728073.1 hypothetical protein [Streptomyces caniscabiei]WEO23168.1 hypothetical protein IHE65_08365 [Streptomyces caniscabiei]